MAVQLGGITIDPGPRQELRLGGNQSLVRQDIPGAGPAYQDMGSEEETLSWDGYLDGDTAVATALQLDDLRRQGRSVAFSSPWLPVLQVRIRQYEYRVVRATRVQYSIDLVRDGGTPEFTPAPQTAVVAAADSPAESAATVTPSRTYTVVAGDTLWGIAQRFLGDGNQWPALAAANGVDDPTLLQIGQVLQVPGSRAEAATITTQRQAHEDQLNDYARALQPVHPELQ